MYRLGIPYSKSQPDFASVELTKILKMRLFCRSGGNGGNMKTGLTKRQKTTRIYFDEASKAVEIQTHNTALRKRLAKYASDHPDLCRQTDDDEQDGLTF